MRGVLGLLLLELLAKKSIPSETKPGDPVIMLIVMASKLVASNLEAINGLQPTR